ncbi:Crp/Fnr family transcriptional regulator [Salinisphaera orenii]|uniref:Crp/Fnr family transcriptional regulator n=1 Tax=Salinisphaera orenii TaxID=856731 RepID=UPI000DBE1876
MRDAETRRLLARCRDAGIGALCESARLSTAVNARVFGSAAETVWLAAGETFRFGDRASACRIARLERGALTTEVVGSGPVSGLVGVWLPGDIVGLDTLAGDGPDETIRAATDSVLRAVTGQFFQRVRATEPRVANAVDRLIGRELRRRAQQCRVVCRCDADQRLAIFLLSLLCRTSPTVGLSCQLELTVSRTSIADLLGLRLETLSRKFGMLEYDGVIDLQGPRVVLIDGAALTRRAGVAEEPLTGATQLEPISRP